MRIRPAHLLPLVLVSACATGTAAAPQAAMPEFPPLSAPATQEAESPHGPLMTEAAVVQSARSPSRPLLTRAASVFEPKRKVAVAEPFPGTALAGTAPAKPREMLDIEATLNIVVEQVAVAAAELRKLASQHGGVLIEDLVEQSTYSSARFLIRVEARETDALLSALEGLGQVRTRLVNARDIGKQCHDAELQLENLKVAMERYEQILAKAESVTDIVSVERELTRLRGEIEQVKGNLRWMQDRVARSTVHVNLASPRLAAVQGPVAPRAKFYPGLRGIFLEDLRGNSVHQGYLGGGISLRINRHFSLDVDGLRRRSTGSLAKGLDVLLVTMGGEAFSQFLGNGTRRFANPYLGWRMGYARFEGKSEFALGATVGLELVKTRYVGVDLAVRGMGLLGKSAHLVLQPELTVGFAF